MPTPPLPPPATPSLLVAPLRPRPGTVAWSADAVRAAAQWCASHDYLGAEPPPEPREPVSA